MITEASNSLEPSTLWHHNPVVVQLLGVSPVLAVSTTLVNGIGLGITTTLATILCYLTASLLPRSRNTRWRLLLFLLVIASYVSIIDLVARLYFYPLYRALGIYIPLICANSALLYRMETYASHVGPGAALKDSFMTALGFFGIILAMSALREWLTTGSLLTQLELLSPFPGNLSDGPINTEPSGNRFRFPLLQPGALIILGFLVATGNFLRKSLTRYR